MLKIDVNQNKEQAILKAIDTLQNGGLIIYPTETCYGLGGDATNPKALAKLLSYKKYRGSKPISIAVSNKQMANEYVEINEMANNLYENYLPGPITVISMSKGTLTSPVVSSRGAVGVRIPAYAFTQELIARYGKPITATSANVSYRSTPYSIEKLVKDLPKKSLDLIDLFLDAGQLPQNPPSTVLDTTMNELSVLRQGSVQFENALVKNKKIFERETNGPEETISLAKEFSDKYLKNGIPSVVALSGELGAGKTQFTKGIGQSLGVEGIINSPTYTIINEYKYDGKILAHMDTWRLEKGELEKSGLIENLEARNIVAIEWADKFFEEISALCDNMDIPMYKVVIKHVSEKERSVEIYEG